MPVRKDKTPFTSPKEKGRFKRAWKDSHGYWLLGFAALLFLVGVVLIWTSPPDQQTPSIAPLEDELIQAGIELAPNSLVLRVASNQSTSTGPIRVAVYDSKDAFGDPARAIIKDSLNPVEGFVVWEVELGLLPDSFAIAAYHDLDNNGQLNRALFNAPVEPYGFSNNARSLVGPPTFEQTIMQRPSASVVIEIRVY